MLIILFYIKRMDTHIASIIVQHRKRISFLNFVFLDVSNHLEDIKRLINGRMENDPFASTQQENFIFI